MTPTTNDGRTALTVSREEAWVAHAALLAAIEAAVDGDGASVDGDEAPNGDDDEMADDAPAQLRPLRSIERGRDLDPFEVELLREALVDHLGDAPVRDRAPGRALLRRADGVLDSPAQGGR